MAISSGVLLSGVAENPTFPTLTCRAFAYTTGFWTGLGRFRPTCDRTAGDPISTSKYGSDRAAWVVKYHAWNITVCDFVCLFGFFTSPTGRQSAPIFTIYTSNDALSARKCPLGVSMMNFHIYSPFSPKIWKLPLQPMASSTGNNSLIFKDRRKMFAPKWGFFGSCDLTALSTFASDRPLLPW